jgi:hypothetical protein
MVATHAAVVFVPAVPFWVDIVVTIAALAAAFRFTAWCPGHARKKQLMSSFRPDMNEVKAEHVGHWPAVLQVSTSLPARITNTR